MTDAQLNGSHGSRNQNDSVRGLRLPPRRKSGITRIELLFVNKTTQIVHHWRIRETAYHFDP